MLVNAAAFFNSKTFNTAIRASNRDTALIMYFILILLVLELLAKMLLGSRYDFMV